MPVSPAQIRAALDEKREAFARFDANLLHDLKAYKRAWEALVKAAPDRLQALLPPSEPVGARLLESFDGSDQGALRSALDWPSRADSLHWVRSQLTGITTFAVDGSQVFPNKDISLPVALVQIGWFENHHTADGQYTKDIALDVLTPDDLKMGTGEPVDRQVNIRRFQMETQRLVAYMKGCDRPEHTLVFFDGSLVATFAEAFDPESRNAYVQAMVELLATSQQYQVPLVGYVDTSSAHDVTTLLRWWEPTLNPVETLNDAQILKDFLAWGDRIPLMQCDRGGILDHYGDWGDQVTFTYLRTTRDRPPVRLEFPRWLWASGRIEQVVNWVRAEVIIGSGYPYAIETADQTAVLQAQDRQIFYRILQEWAEREALKLRFSRKLVSKLKRR